MAQSGHLHDHSKHVSFLSRVESIGFVLILLFWSGIILSHQAIGAEKSPSVRPQPSTNSADPFVEEINQFIREGWKENDLEPSPAADDEEWIRRISLDLHGHIPDLEEAEQFLSDKSPVKRANTIDRMLS
ncbi:MAG: DUF1549 domain-containing protein, partial [Planctomycetes bacterium]|nr:DUF1549 domain-containing protein [Planctomycetota bacterium]